MVCWIYYVKYAIKINSTFFFLLLKIQLPENLKLHVALRFPYASCILLLYHSLCSLTPKVSLSIILVSNLLLSLLLAAFNTHHWMLDPKHCDGYQEHNSEGKWNKINVSSALLWLLFYRKPQGHSGGYPLPHT